MNIIIKIDGIFFLLNQSVVKYQVFVSVHQNRRVMLSLETLHFILTFISKGEQPNYQKKIKNVGTLHFWRPGIMLKLNI